MIDTAIASYLLCGLPLVGALFGMLFWGQADRVKTVSIVLSLASFAAVVGLTRFLIVSPEGLVLAYLLPLVACASILGQPIHPQHRLSWVATLVYLGLGLGALTNQDWPGQLAMCVVFVLTTVLLYRHHTALWPMSWWGLGVFALGGLCTVVAAVSGQSLSSALMLLACAVLLPLLPFHDGYITALTRLPGSLPSFTAVLFPALGLHGLSHALVDVPDTALWAVGLFALMGGLFGAVKALCQSRVRLLLAYGSLSFFSITWWFISSSHLVSPQTGVFVGAVGLTTSGLLLAWQVIRTRYGDDVDPYSISGLASTMPKYAVVVSLIALAAMGLPPFGVFAGFVGLLFTSTLTSAAALSAILVVWLAASWYLMDSVQRLLFGRQRMDLRHEDLRGPEFGALLIILGLVTFLGIAPTTLFSAESISSVTGLFQGFTTWNG